LKIKLNIIDKKFKGNKLKYFLQCMLASVTILVVLLFLNILEEAAIITALGASSFIVFAMPQSYSSGIKRLVGGYAVGLIIGFIFFLITNSNILVNIFDTYTILIVAAAFSVGISIFIMTIINTEHAPAAGIALGLVINKWDHTTIIFIIIAVLWMVTIKTIFKKYLIDLA